MSNKDKMCKFINLYDTVQNKSYEYSNRADYFKVLKEMEKKCIDCEYNDADELDLELLNDIKASAKEFYTNNIEINTPEQILVFSRICNIFDCTYNNIKADIKNRGGETDDK